MIAWYSTVVVLMTDYMTRLCLSHMGHFWFALSHASLHSPLYVCCWASPLVASSSGLNLTPSLPWILDIYYHTLPCQCRRLLLKHMCFCACSQTKAAGYNCLLEGMRSAENKNEQHKQSPTKNILHQLWDQCHCPKIHGIVMGGGSGLLCAAGCERQTQYVVSSNRWKQVQHSYLTTKLFAKRKQWNLPLIEMINHAWSHFTSFLKYETQRDYTCLSFPLWKCVCFCVIKTKARVGGKVCLHIPEFLSTVWLRGKT